MSHRSAVQHGTRPNRIVTQPAPGINEPAPYWRGKRAETIVARRLAAYAAKSHRRSTRAGGRTKTPNQQLSRLRRALTRRKTLAGRQSVQRKIDLLLQELHAAR